MQVDLREWHSTSLSDTGSNICLTNNESILTDVKDIDPVSVGVAVASTAALTPCVKKGYLPMPLTDGSIHMQMFLLHADASDTIISPECIMRSDAKFRKWAQIGHQDDTAGTLTFYGKADAVLLTLPVTKTNGLY